VSVLRPAQTARPSIGRRLVAWFASLDDGEILRAAFFGMLTATACVVVIDYLELSARDASLATPPSTTTGIPVLPAFDPNTPAGKPGPAVTTDPKLLEQPLAIDLEPGGVLRLTGTVDVGADGRFAAEIAARGEYVKTVALDSPGGSVEDALAIGKLIRDKEFATSIAPGAFCASSCPLIFAGGKKRLASAKSAIGVHQIYAEVPANASEKETPAEAMSDAQRTTAEISRYLSGMGVDPSLWLDALETPPHLLHYFSTAEMTDLKLVTNLTN